MDGVNHVQPPEREKWVSTIPLINVGAVSLVSLPGNGCACNPLISLVTRGTEESERQESLATW